MTHIRVLVEGQTEETFVGQVLKPHLLTMGIDIDPTVIVTKRTAAQTHRGGVNNWAQVERDLRLMIGSAGSDPVTTMLDYYALPTDVPGMTTRPIGVADQRALHVEASIEADLAAPSLRAYLSLHEIEALLYVDPVECGSYLGAQALTTMMQAALLQCGSPEEVNDSPTTAPSKRIVATHPGYRKTADGPAILGRIGVANLRAACPHFDTWLDWMESFAI